MDKMGYEEWEVEKATESEFVHVLVAVVAAAEVIQAKEQGGQISEAQRTTSGCPRTSS